MLSWGITGQKRPPDHEGAKSEVVSKIQATVCSDAWVAVTPISASLFNTVAILLLLSTDLSSVPFPDLAQAHPSPALTALVTANKSNVLFQFLNAEEKIFDLAKNGHNNDDEVEDGGGIGDRCFLWVCLRISTFMLVSFHPHSDPIIPFYR